MNQVEFSVQGLLDHAFRLKMKNSQSALYDDLPIEYREAQLEFDRGGAGKSSVMKYFGNVMGFWKTMRRIGIDDKWTLGIPTDPNVLIIYMIDCAKIREKPNVWDTMRGKLRAIDFYAQSGGVIQHWNENVLLAPAVAWYKANRKGNGSDTVPILARTLKKILRHTMRTKVYFRRKNRTNEQLDEVTALRIEALKMPKKWGSRKQLKWYLWAMSVLFVTVLGLRGAECLRQSKKEYKGYGIQMRDVVFIHENANGGKLIVGDQEKPRRERLHHIRVELRFSKTAKEGKSVFLRIGRTNKTIDPAMLIYKVFWRQKEGWNGTLKKRGQEDYLFEIKEDSMNYTMAKRMWKEVVNEVIDFDPEKHRYHGLRKGFASQLLRCGSPLSLICFAGRWQLQAAVFDYAKHQQWELINIVSIYLYGEQQNRENIDLDEPDLDEWSVVIKKRIESDSSKEDVFENTNSLYEGGMF